MDQFEKKIFSATVTESEVIAEGVKQITFKLDDLFIFQPWQYVWIEIPTLIIPDTKGNRRAFSILNSSREDNTIGIVVRASERGYTQSLVALKKGDTVRIHGPFGNSFVVEEGHQPEHIVMIAGGVGIAAFLPMLHTIKDKSYRSKCHFVYLNKNKEGTPFLSELEALKKEGDFFDYTVSYKNFSWSDVRSVAPQLSEDVEWWITGPQAMIDQVVGILEDKGVLREDMVFENYYPIEERSLSRAKVEAQASSDNLFAKAIQNSTNHTVITDVNGVVLFANKAAETITGYTSEEILGNTPRLWGGMMDRKFYVDLWKCVGRGESFSGEIVNRRKNGELYHALAHIAPILGEKEEVIGYIGTEEDITSMNAHKDELESMNALMIGRELAMVKLKEQIKELTNTTV